MDICMEAIPEIDTSETMQGFDALLAAKQTPKGLAADSGSLTSAHLRFSDTILHCEKKSKKSQVNRQEEGYEPFGCGFKITPSDEKTVRGIIEFMDSKSTISLALPGNQKHLKDEGKKIDNLHPLCFIWVVTKDENLKSKLRTFRDNSAFALKWNGFLGYSHFHDKGFGRNMEKYYNHRNPSDYQHEFDAFYQATGIKPEALNSFVERKDWKGFTSAVIEPSSYK